MTGSSPAEDRDLDRWVSEVTDEWQMPPLEPGEMTWQTRLTPPTRRSRRSLTWPVTVGRVAAGLAAIVIVTLVGGFLVVSIPRTEVPSRPSPTDAAIAGPADVTSDALFSLEISSPRARWSSGEAIDISTTLRYLGAEEATVISHGGAFVVFSIEQLDGAFDQGGGRDDSCDGQRFRPGEVQDVPFQKSGGWSNSDPDAEMLRKWFDDPELRLPAGRYRISGETRYNATECGEMETLTASIVITVEASTGVAPTPSPVSSPTEGASQAPSAQPTGDPGVSDTARDDQFEVSITSPRARWPANEPIEVSATLRYIGEGPGTVSSTRRVPLFLGIEQLDGPFDPVQLTVQPCITSRWNPGDAHEDVYGLPYGWLEAEDLSAIWQQHAEAGTLPPGMYRLYASAGYDLGAGCEAESGGTRAQASIEFVVEGAATTPSSSAPEP